MSPNCTSLYYPSSFDIQTIAHGLSANDLVEPSSLKSNCNIPCLTGDLPPLYQACRKVSQPYQDQGITEMLERQSHAKRDLRKKYQAVRGAWWARETLPPSRPQRGIQALEDCFTPDRCPALAFRYLLWPSWQTGETYVLGIWVDYDWRFTRRTAPIQQHRSLAFTSLTPDRRDKLNSKLFPNTASVIVNEPFRVMVGCKGSRWWKFATRRISTFAVVKLIIALIDRDVDTQQLGKERIKSMQVRDMGPALFRTLEYPECLPPCLLSSLDAGVPLSILDAARCFSTEIKRWTSLAGIS